MKETSYISVLTITICASRQVRSNWTWVTKHTANVGLYLEPFYSSCDTVTFFTALYNILLWFPAVIYLSLLTK
jgi:hypothetical protein